MKMLKILFFPLLVIGSLHAQFIGASEVDEAKIMPWKVAFESEYAGSYHFGDSEGESTLYLMCSEGIWVGQVHSGDWAEDGKSWVKKYMNLENIEVDSDGNFKSDSHSSGFVKYVLADGTTQNGLKINEPWTVGFDKGVYEIGIRNATSFDDLFYGDYTEASFRLLSSDDLKPLSKEQLQIMRNEIFARYGYIFKAGGAIEKHFKQQKWYKATMKNVDAYLTKIEKENIQIINTIEQSK